MRGWGCTAVALIALAGGASSARAQAPAGCDAGRPAVAYHAGASSAHVPDGERLVPCRYLTGARSMEPSMGFTRDGRVLFQGWELQPGSVNGAPLRPVVRRSSADFTRWQDVSPGPAAPVTSLDPYLTVDPHTGRAFSVNFLANGQENCSTIAFTDDAGEHWTASPVACNGFDGESIGAGPPVTSKPVGYPDLVYYCTGTTPASSQPTTTPICSKSIDGGLTFVPTGALPWPLVDQTAEADKFGPWAGNPTVAPDGALYLPKRFAGQPEVAISRDEGASWTRAQVAHNGASGETPRMAVDKAGNLFYAWSGEDHLPYLAASRDGGRHWSPPLPLAPPGLREGELPWPATAGGGRVAVAYLGSTDSPGKKPYYDYCNYLLSPCDDGTYAKVTWNGYMTLVDDVFAADPLLQTATVNPPDKPLFTGGCSADGACKADLDFIGAQFSPDGEPFAAFSDDCRLARDFTPVFGQDFGPCADNLGEGVVGRLVRVSASGTPVPARRCASRRTIVAHVPRRLRGSARSVDVVVGGRIARRGANPRAGLPIDLRGRARGAVDVVLRIHLATGRTVVDRRTYHPCV